MKTLSVLTIALLSIVVGVAIGVGRTMSEFSAERGIDAVASDSSSPVIQPVRERARPRVVVLGEADFDFGVMERNETMQHTFRLKNIGDAASTLREGETTCKCTLSELDKGLIKPGEVVEVTLEWTPNSFAGGGGGGGGGGGDDPDKPTITLEVHGRVVQTVRPVPENIVLSNVSTNEARSATVYVYCYRDQPFELAFDRYENPDLAKFFTVDIEPLPQNIIAAEPQARAGAKVTVTVQPGLPLGPLRQTLHFTSNLENVPELAIPVRGTVSGDISVLGSKSLYKSEHRLITIDAVPRDEGGVYRLQLLVKGPHAPEVDLFVKEVEPADVLQVEIQTENPSRINDGAVLLYPLTITIPKDADSISLFGTKPDEMGRIVLATNHPEQPEITIYVRLIVGG